MKELDFLRKVKSVTFATIDQGQPCAWVLDVILCGCCFESCSIDAIDGQASF